MIPKLIGRCTCCRNADDVEIEHFDLPVFGSEGVWLCLECRRATCAAIAERSYTFARSKRDAALLRRMSRDEEATNVWHAMTGE